MRGDFKLDFSFLIETELQRQMQYLRQSERMLQKSPKGFLRMGKQKRNTAYYQVISHGEKRVEKNISDKPQIVHQLLEKQIQKNVYKAAERNVKSLKALKMNYCDISRKSIVGSLSKSYRNAYHSYCKEELLERQKNVDCGCPYESQYRIHETLSGIMVRSKSEVIIANILTRYGVPFMYEAPLEFSDGSGKIYYPDFTILLPMGKKKFWEHFGILNDFTYCDRTAKKLYTYQMNGILIGRDLIISQDDYRGNCNSAWIDEIVRTQLLPYFF